MPLPLGDRPFSSLGGTRKSYREGTHRTLAPVETLRRVMPHMAAMGITRIGNLTGLDTVGVPVVAVFRPNSKSVSVAQGKGLTLAAAKSSGLMEAVEGFHAETISPTTIASLEELQRDRVVIDVARLPRTPDAELPPAQIIPWSRGRDLATGNEVWVPYELVSADYTLPLPPGTGYFQANTNGLASGNAPLEAVLHGICELIERDATTLWWHRAQEAKAARTVDLGGVDDDACRWVLDRYSSAGVKVTVWDTTTDIDIASFLCAVYGDDERPLPEFGAGCHPSRNIALLRALTEAAQARSTFIGGSRDDLSRRDYTSDWLSTRLEGFHALTRGNRVGMRFGEVRTFDADTIDEDVDHVVARLADSSMRDIVVIDLTRCEFGIPVVRVIIPGLEGLFDHDYAPGPRARVQTSGQQ